MTFTSASQFHVYLQWVSARLEYCLKCESTSRCFNQEKALVGAFSVIVKTDGDGSFAALSMNDEEDEV